jgi:catechol 2,3-dioxygenase-like lactoylglutathione lyase family enzyme
VPDVERAEAFFTEVCRLTVRQREGDVVYITGDRRSHWLAIEHRPETTLLRLGYKATSPAAVTELVDRLRDARVECSQPAESVVRFQDPDGTELEVYAEMWESAHSPVGPEVGLDTLLHAVIEVRDPLASARFYEQVLGFRRSDRIGELVVFMRGANGYHHALAVAKGSGPKLDHFAILVDDIDVLMRLRNHAIATGTLSDDVVRHTASGSVTVYVRDEVNRLGVEFCTEHLVITDPGYRGRVLKPGPTTINMWADPFPVGGWKSDMARVAGAQGGTDAARTALGEALPVP